MQKKEKRKKKKRDKNQKVPTEAPRWIMKSCNSKKKILA